MIEHLFTSKARLKLLQFYLNHLNERYYLRQLESILRVNIRALQIELNNLLNIGFLSKEKDGNRTYYSVNKKFPLLDELRRLILKGSFFLKKLKTSLFGENIQASFIYGSGAEGDLSEGSDIDLFIIGKADPYKLHKTIKDLEGSFSRVINYIVYSPQEVQKRVKDKDGFILNVLNSQKIFIKGTPDDLEKIIKRKKLE